MIMTARRPKNEGEPGVYHADMFGTKIEYRYHTVKAYEYNDEELLASDNPVKLFIYAVKFAARNRKSKRKRTEYTQKILRVLTDKGWEIDKSVKFLSYLQILMKFKGEEYMQLCSEETRGIVEGEKLRPKTLIEELYEQGISNSLAKERISTARSLLGLGLLTDEQIAAATKQSPEDVAALRHKMNIN